MKKKLKKKIEKIFKKNSNFLILIFPIFFWFFDGFFRYEQTGTKHAAWLLHAAAVGAVIAPLTLLGGPLMLRASMYTAGMFLMDRSRFQIDSWSPFFCKFRNETGGFRTGIVGGLSAVAACAPSDKFLMMAGPLAIGLGVVVAASIGSAFVAPTTGTIFL